MDPEIYRQSVSDGAAESARLIVVLGRIIIGAVVVATCLWIGLLFRGNTVGTLNVLFAWLGTFSVSRLLTFLIVIPRVLAVGFVFVVGPPAGWLATRPLAALLTAGVTVAVGVYLSAFSFVEVRGHTFRGREYRRFWHRTPQRMARVLASLSGRRA